MPARSLLHPHGWPIEPKLRESMRLVARRDQDSRLTVCPDCGRLRTNLKNHRGSKLCKRKRSTL